MKIKIGDKVLYKFNGGRYHSVHQAPTLEGTVQDIRIVKNPDRTVEIMGFNEARTCLIHVGERIQKGRNATQYKINGVWYLSNRVYKID